MTTAALVATLRDNRMTAAAFVLFGLIVLAALIGPALPIDPLATDAAHARRTLRAITVPSVTRA